MQKEPMPYSEFQKLAVASASQYLNYLDTTNKTQGVKIVSVYEIQETETPSEYRFLLTEKLANPDYCEIWVDGVATDELEIVTTYKKTRFGYPVKIRDKGQLIGNARFFSPDRVKFVSDMRFLIRRLREFYTSHTLSFSPPVPKSLSPLPEELLAGLSDEQRTAVDGVFDAPVSYINGAPGTGKTNMVLSRCILRYLFNKNKVILLAPTNNAVEQMLRGILPVLRQEGIDLTCVYRLGASTDEFARKYPEVVGDAAVDNLLETLNSRKVKLQARLEKARALEQARISIEKEYTSSKNLYAKLTPSLQELSSLSATLSLIDNELETVSADFNSSEEQHTLLLKQLQTVKDDLLAHEKSIARNEARLRTLAFFFWKTEERKVLLQQIETLRSELTQLEADHVILLETIALSEKKLLDIKKQQKECNQAQMDIRKQISTLSDSVMRFAASNNRFRSTLHPIITAPEISPEPLDQLLTVLDSELDHCIKESETHPIAPILADLEDTEAQLKEIGKTAKQKQKQDALVLAGTIDTIIGAIPAVPAGERSKTISHVFLDEAGYTSLMRGMVAFAFGAPVTFLGDHKQLSPICEMNRIDHDHAPVCLWSLSIVYFPELIYDDFYSLYIDNYCSHLEPDFHGVALFSLNTSYRFGPGLAEVLAKYIYSDSFQGVGASDFKISVMDSTQIPGSFSRSNLGEVQAIAKYIAQEHPQDFAVLTPYNGQVKLLQQTLPRHYRDSVMTVHRAQGREWDTVIFSVTDNPKNMYFTDSRLPVGRRIINTAISRAKCNLIIVCDTVAWSRCADQIISDLVFIHK